MFTVTAQAKAANKCLSAAVQISQDYVVAGTSLKQVRHEPTKDTQIEKYVATLQNNRNTSLIGYVVVVVSARDCSEIMSVPGF